MSTVPLYLKGRGRGRGSDRSVPTEPGGRKPGSNGVSILAGSGGGGRGRAGDIGGASAGWGDEGLGWSAGWVKHKEQQDCTAAGATAEERFKAASSQNQEAIKRHLQEMDENMLDSSSDEEDIGTNVLDKVFQEYSLSGEDIGEAQDLLLHSFRSGTAACLVCIETVRKTDPIWSCEGCHAIFHIQCIQKWIREGVYQQIYKSDDDNLKPDNIPWQCPKCRLEYSQKKFPTRYLCYCGKVEEPTYDPWLVPHSCGQVCGLPLKPACGHSCRLLCHPGACPPCPQTVRVTCYCGNSDPQVRRCSARPWSCNNQCRRLLSCKQHKCSLTCHPGECTACPQTSRQPCLCKKSQAVRPCASLGWQCDKPCGRPLSCGNHVCEKVCHTGSCDSCPRSGLRECPCGKTEFDLPCTEDIPTCGDTCGKLLDCGIHQCVQRCHMGACGACRQMTVKKCRCGAKEREILCCKEYLCETKCSTMRDCGKHQCKRKCCDGSCPSCEQVCNKLLSCKNPNHKCISRCHKGRCYPCTSTVDIYCNCKATKITVPCGREKVTKPPRCNHLCKVPPACHHKARTQHRCHFGDCPPCRQICQKPLAGCDHNCPVSCHTAVKVKVKDNKPRAGPWEGGPRVMEQVMDKPCPPCIVPIQMKCYGKHEVGTFACSVVQPYSCGRKCGRSLACENHACEMSCHTVAGAEDDKMAGTTCQACERPCEFDRPKGCEHPCTRPCHSGPCPPCRQMFRMRCHCGAMMQHIECNKWVAASPSERNQMKSCSGPCPKVLSCGHACSRTCHPGDCSRADECEKKVNVRCKCRRQKRDAKCKDSEEEKSKLVCDETCKKEIERKRKEEEEEIRKKKEAEEEKQKAELEEFERKRKGKKRKPRRQQDEIVEENIFQRNKKWFILGISVVVLAAFVMYIMKLS